MSGEKTEKPTPKKRREARKKGQIGRSPEAGSALGLLAASVLLPMVVRTAGGSVQDLLLRVRGVIAAPDAATVLALARRGAADVALAAAPLAAGLLLVGIGAAAAQGGVRPVGSLLKPKFSRLNPVTGIKRVLGPHSAWETAKALLKTVVLGIVLYGSVRQLVPVLVGSGSLPLAEVLHVAGGTALSLVRTAALTSLVLAAADYMVVRRRTGKQLKMTRQEVKEEHRQSDGDPHLKGAIRSRQIAMSRNRMMADLAKADVVIVNPTHVAVALRYDPARGAPRVVAKGAGTVAARIREVATEHRIPLVADVPLARALYQACELGQEIPGEMYTAVARVLAFVMTLKARGSAAGLHRSPALAG